MRTTITSIILCFFYLFAHAQNVGIGTTTPIARLHVTDSNVVFTGPATLPGSTTYNPPIQGAGTRMMWYPQKGAFRAGYVDGTQWDKNNIGKYSFATGVNTVASGDGAFAHGFSSAATSFHAIAMGFSTTASGQYSIGMGNSSSATGDNAIALGYFSTASAYNSTAIGTLTTASGNYSTVTGLLTSAKSFAETAIGAYNTDYTPLSSTYWNATDRLFVIGNGTASNITSDALVVLKNGNTGIGTSVPNAPLQFANTTVNRKIVLFESGNNDNQYYGFGVNGGVLRYQVSTLADDHVFYSAASASSSTELMRIKGNGNVGIGTPTPFARLHIADSNVVFTGPATLPGSTAYNPPIQGAGTRMMWYPQKAAFRVGTVNGTQWDKNNIGLYSTAMGFNTTSSGNSSTAMGAGTAASGQRSTAMGSSTTASGVVSTAMGNSTTASDDYSTAMGYFTTASGLISTTMGAYTLASGEISTAMGSNTIASGNISIAIGDHTTAKSYAETTIGAYNTDYTPLSSIAWNTADRLFVIGNGSSGLLNSDAMVVLKNGNTGIGTSSPNAPLQFANTTVNRKIVLFESGNNDHQYYGFGVNGGVLRYQVSTLSDDHIFYAAASASSSNELMRIKGNGNVGIGVPSPNYKLHIGQSNSGLRVEGPAAAGGIAFSIGGNGEIQIDKVGTVGGRFIIKENGFVGIDKNNPAYKLDVTGDINASGNVRANGIALTSDERFKQNINNIPNALNNLLQLRGTDYFFNREAFPDKNFSANKQMGVIAQEVENIFPELVSTDKEGYKSVNYIGLIPVMIESIKTQQQQINELKQLVNKLINK